MNMQAVLGPSLHFLLSNFSFCMFLIAVLFILVHKLIFSSVPESEIIFRWIAFFVVGLSGVFTFIMHAYFPYLTSASIGWFTTPFEFEVAVADLALGILGILSFQASFGFRVATSIAATILLWGDGIGHINQMLLQGNFSVGNAGTWFWMDVALPFILILCLLKMRIE